MYRIEKIVIGLCLALLISIAGNIYQYINTPVESLGANTQFGMPCIYMTATQTLSSGSGTALLCDEQGRLILTE